MKRLALLISIVFLAHFLPFLLNGDNAYIRIHDNLEGEWVWLNLLVSEGKALDYSPHSIIEPVMNGQPRAVFPTGLSMNVLLIYLFGSYWSYIISYVLQHLMAFFGMYFLLRKYFLTEPKHHFIVVGISLCFSLVPFYLQFGVFAIPVLLLCFLNILNRNGNIPGYFFIAIFPLFSSMVWMGVSALTAFSLIWVYNFLQNKKIHFQFLFAIALLAAAYCAVNFQMLSLSFFNKGFISHRAEYDIFALQEISFSNALSDTIYPLLLSHYHVGTMITVPILISAFMALYYSGKDKIIIWLLIAIATTCFTYGFYMCVAYLLGDVFPILITFKANRFIILLPLLFFLLFAVSLKKISDVASANYVITIFLCCQLATGFFSNDEWLHNARNLLGFQIKPGYKEFHAENLFKEIDSYIAQPKNSYRVAGLGITTGVTQHNAFYTLDGLQAIYALEHKKEFREIIEPETTKSEEVRKYFDAWGNRCYIFSSELGIADRNFIIGKNQGILLKDFSINTMAFRQMGGKYLFSAVEIPQPEKTGLKLLKIFEDDESWWRIHLYEAI